MFFFGQYLDTLFVKDPQAGMDYHELQVKPVYSYKGDYNYNHEGANCAKKDNHSRCEAREKTEPARKRSKHITLNRQKVRVNK